MPIIKKIKRAVQNPNRVIPYLLSKFASDSDLRTAQRYKRNSREKEAGINTSSLGGFAGGVINRPSFAARNFYEIRSIQTILSEFDIHPSTAIEIGSGYGRLSPWIWERTDDFLGLEPNPRAHEMAKNLYPEITYKNQRIQDVQIKDSHYDFCLSWTVLQHIPPRDFDSAVDTITKSVCEGGYLLICEETLSDNGDERCYPRKIHEYEAAFSEFELISSKPRQLEPSSEFGGGEIMLFKMKG